MASDEELLDILLQIRATGLAEADAVNQVLANTGNVATTTESKVKGLTAAQAEHAGVLQTANTFATNYGGTLTAQEASYARLQLGSKEFAAEERNVASEASAAARAMGAVGGEASHVLDRFTALGALAGSGGGTGILFGAGLVGAGVVLEAGKSMVENADKNEAAQRNLEQAFASQGKELSGYQGVINSFIDTNRRYISSEYTVKDAIAEITRAGFDWNQTQRLLNDAVDLSAAKHVSLSDATKVLIDAEHGRAMGLLDLGIAIKQIEDPQKALDKALKDYTISSNEKIKAERELAMWEDNHHDRSYLTQADLIHEQMLKEAVTTATQKQVQANRDAIAAQSLMADKGNVFNQVLDQVETKTAGARGNISNLTQAQNDLRVSWDDLSNKYGPGLEEELARIVDGINYKVLPAFDELATQIDDSGTKLDALAKDPNWPNLMALLFGSPDQQYVQIGNTRYKWNPDMYTFVGTDVSPTLSGQRAGGSARESTPSTINNYNVTVNVNAPGGSASQGQAIARAIRGGLQI